MRSVKSWPICDFHEISRLLSPCLFLTCQIPSKCIVLRLGTLGDVGNEPVHPCAFFENRHDSKYTPCKIHSVMFVMGVCDKIEIYGS